MRHVNVGPGRRSCATPRHAAKLFEDGAPVDLVRNHVSQLLPHPGANRSPLTVAVCFFDRVLENLSHLTLDELFLLVGHLTPAIVVVEAVALALGLFTGFLVLHDLSEVPLLRLMLGKASDELSQRAVRKRVAMTVFTSGCFG